MSHPPATHQESGQGGSANDRDRRPLRITLVGPESSGKTTLARLLAEHYGAAWVEEYVREYMERRGVGRGYARPFAPDDLEHIGRGQAAAEDRAAKRADSLLLCDTELLTTEIWGEIYFGAAPQWVMRESRRRRYDLYLLLAPDIAWDDDGTREFPHRRDEHFHRLRGELDARALPYTVISGDYDARLRAAIAVLDDFIRTTEEHEVVPQRTSC